MCPQPVLGSSSEHHARCRAGSWMVRHTPEQHYLAFCPEQRILHSHPHLPHCPSLWRKLRGSAVTAPPLTREARGGGCSETVVPGGAIMPHITWKGAQPGIVGQMPGSGVFSLVQDAAVLRIYTVKSWVSGKGEVHFRHTSTSNKKGSGKRPLSYRLRAGGILLRGVCGAAHMPVEVVPGLH